MAYRAIFDSRFDAPGDWAHGVDISGFQPNYEPHPEDEFAYIKLSEGVGYVSAEAFTQAPRFSCPIGGYHFAKGRSSAAEAQNYVDVVRAVEQQTGARFTLPHALDLEDGANPAEGWDRWSLDWCARVEQALAQPTLIYTAGWWANGRLATNLGGRDLWVANYAPPGVTGPQMPVQWGEWAIWQWTSTPQPGESLDRNVCARGWLDRFYEPVSTPTPEPLGVEMPDYLLRARDTATVVARYSQGAVRSLSTDETAYLLGEGVHMIDTDQANLDQIGLD